MRLQIKKCGGGYTRPPCESTHMHTSPSLSQVLPAPLSQGTTGPPALPPAPTYAGATSSATSAVNAMAAEAQAAVNATLRGLYRGPYAPFPPPPPPPPAGGRAPGAPAELQQAVTLPLPSPPPLPPRRRLQHRQIRPRNSGMGGQQRRETRPRNATAGQKPIQQRQETVARLLQGQRGGNLKHRRGKGDQGIKKGIVALPLTCNMRSSDVSKPDPPLAIGNHGACRINSGVNGDVQATSPTAELASSTLPLHNPEAPWAFDGTAASRAPPPLSSASPAPETPSAGDGTAADNALTTGSPLPPPLNLSIPRSSAAICHSRRSMAQQPSIPTV